MRGARTATVSSCSSPTRRSGRCRSSRTASQVSECPAGGAPGPPEGEFHPPAPCDPAVAAGYTAATPLVVTSIGTTLLALIILGLIQVWGGRETKTWWGSAAEDRPPSARHPACCCCCCCAGLHDEAEPLPERGLHVPHRRRLGDQCVGGGSTAGGPPLTLPALSPAPHHRSRARRGCRALHGGGQPRGRGLPLAHSPRRVSKGRVSSSQRCPWPLSWLHSFLFASVLAVVVIWWTAHPRAAALNRMRIYGPSIYLLHPGRLLCQWHLADCRH